MNQLDMDKLLSRGHKKVKEAQKLLHAIQEEEDYKCHETLSTLSEWFYNNAYEVKEALRNDRFITSTRRRMLEKLICNYTIVILEIDEYITRQLIC